MRRLLPLLIPVALLSGLLLWVPARGPQDATFIPDGTKISDCSQGDLACYRQALGSLTIIRGVPAAFDLLRATMLTDRSLLNDCHDVVHAIGKAALIRANDVLEEAIAGGEPICRSGFAHAIIEREVARSQEPDPGVAGARLGAFCSRADLWPAPIDRLECLHGLGHGWMLSQRGDLPFVLDACAAANTDLGAAGSDYCALGAFMELQSPTSPDVRVYWREGDLFYPCQTLNERFATVCYGQLVTRFANERIPQEEAAGLCQTIPLFSGKMECLLNLLLLVNPANESAEGIGRICAGARPYAPACLSGYIRGRADRESTEIATVSRICYEIATSPAAGSYREMAIFCARAIGYYYVALAPIDRCRALLINELQTACADAAREPESLGEFIATPIN